MVPRVNSHMRNNAVAYLALFFALSGTAIAAKPLITGADIQDGTIGTADVADDSLTGNDIAEASLGQVPSAATAGSAGNSTLLGGQTLAQVRSNIDAAKLQGLDASSFLRGVSKVTGDDAEVAPKEFGTSQVTCPSGQTLTGGGWEFRGGGPELRVLESRAGHPSETDPVGNKTWVVSAFNDDLSSDGGNNRFRAIAHCAY